MYSAIEASLLKYEGETLSAWAKTVGEIRSEKLTLNLISRDPTTGAICVNFDTQLIGLLAEVRYLVLQSKRIPAEAAELYERSDKFRVHRSSLELVCAQVRASSITPY